MGSVRYLIKFYNIQNDTKYYKQLKTQRVKIKSKNKKHGYNKQQTVESSYLWEKKENAINNPKKRGQKSVFLIGKEE